MAYRDLRGGSRHFLPILAGIALGVGAVVGVGTAADTVQRAVSAAARSLMAADVEIASTRELTASASSAVEAWTGRGVERSGVTELLAMASGPRFSALIELKAVEAGYPFYGQVETVPFAPLAGLLGGGPPYGAVVQEAFLIRSGLRSGDHFTLGSALFVVTAVLRAEPDRVLGTWSLGPRVLISREALSRTGLVQPGSRVRYRTLLRVPETLTVDVVRREVEEALRHEPVQVRAFTEAQPQLRRTLDRLATYLGLVGLTALLIGGVGVAGSLRAFLSERWRTIAVLKCLGAGPRTIMGTFLCEVGVLGLAGGLLGAAIGAVGQRLLTGVAGSLVTIDLAVAFSPWPYARGVAIGLLAILVFALRPLIQASGHSPAAVFRREIVPAGRRTRHDAIVLLVWATACFAMAWWQAGSFGMAAMFVCAVAVAGGTLAGAARGLARAVRAAPHPRRLAWRRGLASLYRPGASTATVLVSIGIGVMTVLTVVLVERSIHAELAGQMPREAPSLFFIDVQPDQRDAFDALMASRRIPLELTPVVRSRLLTVNGVPVGSDGPPGTKPEHRWYFTREYVLTFRDDLPRDNAVVAGTWWNEGPRFGAARQIADTGTDEAAVSIEEEAARRLGVTVGSSLVFDVQGMPVAARVANLRSVNWNSRATNFYAIFAPGILEAAPLTYLGAAQVPEADETSLQQAVVGEFPNITTIQVRDILVSASRVVDRIIAAVRAVAVLTVLAGCVVLAGSLTAARDARLREAMILKALGAPRRTVARAFAIEFGILGLAAGVIGTVLASALAWSILRWMFDLPWVWAPGALAAAIGLATAGTMAVGVLSTYRLVGKRPSVLLRGDW